MCTMDMSALVLLHFAWKGAAWTIPNFKDLPQGLPGLSHYLFIVIYFTYIYVYIYIYAYMHAYIPTYIHTYLHTYVRTYVHTCIHTYCTNKKYIVIDNMSRHTCLSENSCPPCFENPLVCQCLLYLLYIHWCINPIFRYTQASPSPPIWRITPLLS